MAIEVEGTSQVEEFLGILKRRVWWIAIPTIVIGALGISIAVIVPKKFVSTAEVLVRDITSLVQQSSAGAVSRMEGYVAPHVIGSRERITQVLNDLQWSDFFERTVEEQEEHRARLMASLAIGLTAVQNNAGAQIVRARFSHTSPQRAYQFLRSLIDSWKNEVQLRFETSERSRLEKMKSTESQMLAERTRVSSELELKRRNSRIRPEVKLPGRPQSGLLASAEFAELERIEESIQTDEGALKDLEARIATWQKQFDATPATRPRAQTGETASGVAADVERLNRRKLELELDLATKGWTAISINYRKATSELQEISEKLDELRGLGAGNVVLAEVEEIHPVRVDLARKIDEARGEHAIVTARLERNRARRDELRDSTDRLYREHQDIELLQARFDELTEQIKEVGTERALQESQVAMIESDAGRFFEVLEAPREPLRPSTPNPYIIAGLALALGLSIGLGLAVVTEYSRSTFRSARDLSRVMVVPVLGTVNRIVTRRQRSRVLFAQVALVTGTLAFLGVVGYITWAWVYDPESLSAPLRSAIDGLREPFL